MAASDAIPGADGVFAWRIRSCECGPDAFATMPSICNLLQDDFDSRKSNSLRRTLALPFCYNINHTTIKENTL